MNYVRGWATTIIGADRGGRKRQSVIHRCGGNNTCTRTHTNTSPLTANAIEGRITAKSIRTNLHEMK